MATGTVTYEAPSWNQIYQMLLDQAVQIRKSQFVPEVIVGVCRGGWVPARVLSDLLGNSNLASVKAENYTSIGKAKNQPTLTQSLSVNVARKRVLVVDDVADSGKSLQLVLNHIQQQGAAETKTAALYYKPTSSLKPDFYQKETSLWVVFPWELQETLQEIAENADAVKGLVAAGIPKQLIDQVLKREAEKC